MKNTQALFMPSAHLSVLLLMWDSSRTEILMRALARSYWFDLGAERHLPWILPSVSAPHPFMS